MEVDSPPGLAGSTTQHNSVVQPPALGNSIRVRALSCLHLYAALLAVSCPVSSASLAC